MLSDDPPTHESQNADFLDSAGRLFTLKSTTTDADNEGGGKAPQPRKRRSARFLNDDMILDDNDKNDTEAVNASSAFNLDALIDMLFLVAVLFDTYMGGGFSLMGIVVFLTVYD